MLDNNYTEKKLGRGLSALLGESKAKSSLPNIQSQVIIEKIELTKIVAGVYQPRTNFDSKEIEELAKSISEKGVIQPIILRKIDDEDNYEIIAGERRYRASQIANLKKIPAIIKKINNNDALEIALIENIQRSDLLVTEEAKGYKRLIDDFSYTQEMIAEKVGKSRSHITNLLRILNLPKKVLEYLDNKKISMGHARAIINSNNPEELLTKVISDSLNVREIEEIVRQEKEERFFNPNVIVRNESKIKFVNGEELKIMEARFSEALNLESKIFYNALKENGRLVIKFNNIEEIQEILARLSNF